MHRRWLVFISLICTLSIFITAPLSAQEAVVVPTEAVEWDGQSRFTVLVMGMDRRPGARDNLNARTDAIFIISFDPFQERIGIMHIPRDMHMALLEGAESLVRVNTLMVRGESRAEGYGPYFAMETLQNNFGMFIDAYIAFDFEAFINFIDLIGGIEVDVPYIINDPTYPDMNYGFDPLYLTQGLQTFDGRTALQFARTRHGDNDYLRGERQMQVMLAVRDRISNPLIVQELVANADALLESFSGNVYTNIPAEQFAYLGLTMLLINPNNVMTGALNEDYSFPYADRGNTVRVPDRELLPQLFTNIFGENYWQ